MLKRLILVTKLFNSIATQASHFSEQYPLTVFNCKNTGQAIHQKLGTLSNQPLTCLRFYMFLCTAFGLKELSFLRNTGWKVCTAKFGIHN